MSHETVTHQSEDEAEVGFVSVCCELQVGGLRFARARDLGHVGVEVKDILQSL